jgi:hypothetical protein
MSPNYNIGQNDPVRASEPGLAPCDTEYRRHGIYEMPDGTRRSSGPNKRVPPEAKRPVQGVVQRNELPTQREEIDSILAEREKTHGDWNQCSHVASCLKQAIAGNQEKRSGSQREALDMILTKIARIVCGDPNHLDSWLDISGYSMLVVKELEGWKHLK